MSDAQRKEMTARIANQISIVMSKGADYETALGKVYNDINEKWPVAMAEYCNAG